MKNILIVISIFTSLTLFSQEKGVAPLNPKSEIRNPKSVRAVVIGISDYFDPLIPDLKYADRDAEAFAQWLLSPAGGVLPDSSIRLLINERATTAQMIVSLDWLIEKSKPGDRAFIYFSGHGDVERVTKYNLGYLLGYNSPPAVYGAGAFSLEYLRAILNTLSEKEVQVFVITDACRAGKLAGSSINGTQVTANQLSQQMANEIKVLSCQPDEFSLEGEQWGGGRGCFSYHLEDALYGLADDNHDSSVDLLELRRYLEDKVSAEANPQSQVPMVTGPVKTKIAQVNEGEIAARKAAKDKKPVPFLDIENRGMEDRLLTKSDTIVQRLYGQFLAAIDSGLLLQPSGHSANDYFLALLDRPDAAPLQGTMKRKLAAALMDEGQTILNKVLKTDPEILDNIWANQVNYDHMPAYFERAAEILGVKHYVWRDLKAKEFYFRAMTIREENYPDNSAEWRISEKRRLLEKSLEWDSMAAETYHQLGRTFPYRSQERIVLFEKAADLSPDWVLIHLTLGVNLPDPSTAIYHHKKAIELDSNFLPPYNFIALVYDGLGQNDSAIFWRKLYFKKFLQKIENDSASVTSYECADVGNALWRLHEHEKAIAFLLLGEKISKGKNASIYAYLTIVYTDLLEFENAAFACREIAFKFKDWCNVLGTIYFNFMNDPIAAAEAFSRAGDEFDSNQIQFHLSMGNLQTAYLQAKKWKPTDLDYFMVHYYAAEAARQMGMPDTANFYYRQIIEKAKIEFVHTNEAPNYLFVALAYSRLGKAKELRLLLGTVKEKLNGDPWLYFYLACINAQTHQEKAAIESLQKAIALGWLPSPLEWLHGTLCDPLLNPIRETEAYKKLVREHFPKYYDIATRVPGRD